MQPKKIMVGWTTTKTRAAAERLARGLVQARLVACAQISGPVSSYYRWSNKLEKTREYRVTLKFAAIRAKRVCDWLDTNHPYETPQWVAVRADSTLKNYLKWVVDNPT
jgi:periplasmic divalent cation tolerance protein